MQSPLRNATQAASAAASRQQAMKEATVARKATTATAQPLSLPEDVVTLSSAREERKASQPVSSQEKRALLQPSSPRNSFSVYG